MKRITRLFARPNNGECISTRHRMLALAVAVALGAPTAAGAQDLGFNYLEGGIIADLGPHITGAGETDAEIATDADSGDTTGQEG